MQTRIVQIANELLNKLNVRELDNDSIKKIMALGDKLSEVYKNSILLQQKILNSYNVEEKNGHYNWVGHKEEKLINKKIESVLNEDIYEELKPLLNFMSEDDFITSSKANLDTAQMRFLKEYLVK